MKKIWIRLNLVFGVTLLTLILTAFYISCLPLNYYSTAYISYYPYAYDIKTEQEINKDIKIDHSIFFEEEKILRTDKSLSYLSSKLALTRQPEYNPDLNHKKLINTFINNLISKKNEGPNTSLEEKIETKLNRNIFYSFTPYSEIRITAHANNPDLAQDIANKATEIFLEQKGIFGKKELLQSAQYPQNPSFEHQYYLVVIACIFGISLGIFLAFFLPYTSNKN